MPVTALTSEFYTSIVKHGSDLITVMDRKGIYRYVSDSVMSVLGYGAEELMGTNVMSLIHQQDLGTVQKTLPDILREKQTAMRPFRLRDSHGAWRWLSCMVTNMLDNPDVRGLVIHSRDITQELLELQKKQESLLTATEHLNLHNKDLQQFNYIVSHNLRAPVANLVGLSGMLQKLERNSSRFNEGLLNLEKSARRLDGVIQDLNKILAIRNAEHEDARELVNLKEVTEEVLQGMQHLLDTCESTITVDLSEDDRLWANRAYVHSILQNLVSNAIKYKSANRHLQLEIRSTRTEGCLSLTVKDNGSGMDMEKVRPQLFQLYKRFHSNREGKGIGLYLVKSQVEALGGRIDVESHPEIGTTFSLRFDWLQHDKEGIYN